MCAQLVIKIVLQFENQILSTSFGLKKHFQNVNRRLFKKDKAAEAERERKRKKDRERAKKIKMNSFEKRNNTL